MERLGRVTIAIDASLIEDIKKRITRYCTANDFDDAVQEALIRAWQLSGSDLTREKLLLKAVDRGKAVVNKGAYSTPLGKPARERTGRRHTSGDVSRQKIRQLQDDFNLIHGRLPTVTEISKALGMSTRNVRDHLERMKTARRSLQTDQAGRIIEAMQLSSVEIDTDYMGETVEFEEKLLSDLTFLEIVAPLSTNERELMYLCHVQGMTNAEVSRCLGKSDSTVRKHINQTHHTLHNHILTAQPL